jgi:hypothetical protein
LIFTPAIIEEPGALVPKDNARFKRTARPFTAPRVLAIVLAGGVIDSLTASEGGGGGLAANAWRWK